MPSFLSHFLTRRSAMEFWGVEVKGGEPLQCYPGEEYLVHVSQACLGEKKKDKGNEPVYIYVKIDDKKFVIGTLSHDKFPQSVLHLVFEKEFELSHTGKNASVHFTGYKVLKQDNSRDLRRLRLVLCVNVSNEGLVEVAGRMPNLEELDLSHCCFSSETVATVGRLCSKLVSFKLNATEGPASASEVSDDEAFAIANNMSGLHHLQIFGNRLTNAGLVAILDSCQCLESLDLRKCSNINLLDLGLRRFIERFKDFRHPYASTADYSLRPDKRR